MTFFTTNQKKHPKVLSTTYQVPEAIESQHKQNIFFLGGDGGKTYTWLNYFKRTIINMKNLHNWRLTLITERLLPQISDLPHSPCFSLQISEKEMCADQNLRPTLQYRLFCLGTGREVSGICNGRML